MVALYRTRIFRRLFLSIVGLTLFFFGAMSLAILIRTRETIEARQLEISVDYGSQVASRLLAWIEERKADIRYLARDLEISAREGAGPGGIEARLTAFAEASPRFADILIVGTDGYVRESLSEAGRNQLYVGDRDYFREARAGGLYVSGYFKGRLTGAPSFAVSAPQRRDYGGNEVLAGIILLEDLTRIVDEFGLAEYGEVFLVDRDRRVVSTPDFVRAYKATGVAEGDFVADSLAVREVVAARNGFGRYRDVEGREVFGSYRWIPDLDLGLVVELSAALALKPVTSLLEFTFLISLTMLVLLFFLAWTLASRLIAPIAALIEGAQGLSEDRYRGPIEISTGTELDLLVKFFNRMAERVREREEGLRESAARDSLTGLFNHGRIEDFLEQEFRRKRRAEGRVAFAMIDIDHFKAVNDRHGHQAGDQVLRRLARILAENAREGDTVGRYGGEEFCVILNEASEEAAASLCERLRARVEAEVFEAGQEGLGITVSLGWAVLGARGASPFDLVRRADRALYEAKKQGRNRVVGAPELVEAPSPAESAEAPEGPLPRE